MGIMINFKNLINKLDKLKIKDVIDMMSKVIEKKINEKYGH